jgi:ATP-dependent helicase HrpB
VPSPLPIDAVLPELLAAVRARGAAVLRAAPGAGKTTRVPPALLDLVAGRVIVLEPRRVAARAAARRIAAERGWTLGREVGWWIRFERRFTDETRLVFATEGILLRWLQADPFLEGVGALVFDEFHERALAADLALALARRVRREARRDLALVVLSATLDAGPIADFLGGAPSLASEGRLHPVETRLLDRADDRPLELRVASACRRALAESAGDLLVFLPGRREIARAEEALAPLAAERGLDLRPLHGELEIERQDAALRRGARRRIVLATNVAETSVTVEGVSAVVDSGLARQLRFDPATGLDRLETVRIARAAADQRAGRAGREGPGLCLRLWTAADDLALRPFEPPEVRRVDLAGAVLELAAFGEDARAFDWFEPPEPARLERARRELVDLGALGELGITRLGRRLAAMPLAPRLGRLVLEGERLGVAAEAALAAALLAEGDPTRADEVARRDGRASSRSDLADRLERLDRRRHGRLFAARDQILDALRREAPAEKVGTGTTSEEPLVRAIAAAYLDRLCIRREPGSERAVLAGGRGVRLAPTSAVRDAPLFVAVDLDAGRAGERAEGRVRVASAVEREWLPAELVRTRDELVWDDGAARVAARRVTRFEDLVLEQREIPVADPAAAAALLVERAAAQPERALPLGDRAVAALLDRLAFLAASSPELGLPADRGEIVRAALPALAAGRRSFAELARAPLADELLATLEWRQRRALDELAPERLELPTGFRARIDYSDPSRPVLAARIQDLFGLAETPRLGAGRRPLLLHLLAPNGRPQQVTDDLASFWANTYPQVRRELAGRYPKHAWPDDPARAQPARRPRGRG